MIQSFSNVGTTCDTGKSEILEVLEKDKLITKNEAGSYDVTNLGAILFARKISDFPSLERKAVRVIKYSGNSRTSSASKEQIGLAEKDMQMVLKD